MSDQIRLCPSCGGRLRDESLGWRCEKCKGVVDMQGKFHAHVERPFMPPMTNADRIRAKTDEELARLLIETHVGGASAMKEIILGEPMPHEMVANIIAEVTPAFIEWLQRPADEEGNT